MTMACVVSSTPLPLDDSIVTMRKVALLAVSEQRTHYTDVAVASTLSPLLVSHTCALCWFVVRNMDEDGNA